MTAQTRPAMTSVSEPTLYVAFELGAKEWTLAMTLRLGTDALAAEGAGGRSTAGGAAARAGAQPVWAGDDGVGGELL